MRDPRCVFRCGRWPAEHAAPNTACRLTFHVLRFMHHSARRAEGDAHPPPGAPVPAPVAGRAPARTTGLFQARSVRMCGRQPDPLSACAATRPGGRKRGRLRHLAGASPSAAPGRGPRPPCGSRPGRLTHRGGPPRQPALHTVPPIGLSRTRRAGSHARGACPAGRASPQRGSRPPGCRTAGLCPARQREWRARAGRRSRPDCP